MMDHALMEKLSSLTEEEQEILNGREGINRDLYMDAGSEVISGDKLLEKGKLMAVRPHTRFVHFPKHTHDYVEMVYMCKGSTTHTVGETKLTLQAGDLLILAQNAEQEIEPAGEADIAVNFIIRPDFFSGVLPYLGEQDSPLKQFLIDCLCGKSDTYYLFFHVSDILPVQNLVENLLLTQFSQQRNKREILQMTMGLLFLELMNHTDMLQVETGEQNAVVSVLRYIEDHYRNGSLTEIADTLHFNMQFLSRLIKQKTGKTYTELLQEKRLAQAGWLLRNTDKNVDEIAMSVGYENISYFHRIFFARYGLSPKHYRTGK